MSTCLKLTVEPGYSLSQNFREPYFKFIIGMPLNQVIDIISSESGFKKVDFFYSQKIPLHHDIIITLKGEGIKLFFNSDSQQLKKIEMDNFNAISVYYCNGKFNDLQELPNKDRVIQIFGPTKIPEFDNESKSYVMSYSGLKFYFMSMSNDSIIAKQSWIVSKLQISNPGETVKPEPPFECLSDNKILLKQLRVLRNNFRTQTVEFDLLTATETIYNRIIRFGDSVQYVLEVLGTPSRLYYKTEDKMKIHSPRQHQERIQNRKQMRKSDYFFNYLTLGIDVMFRYENDTVAKFILHTNFPEDFLFNTYYRCCFTIDLEKDSDYTNNNSTDDEDVEIIQKKAKITTLSKWSEVHSLASIRVDKHPVDVTRFQDHCHKSGISSQTLAYGLDDLIFEILPENDHISSVTIYQVSPEDIEY